MKIDVRYVVEDVDRHGNVRVYFRRKGQKKVRLLATFLSAAWWAEYKAALNGGHQSQSAISGSAANRQSFRWLCQLYYGDADFLQLNPDTQLRRRRLLDRFCKDNGANLYKEMQARHVRKFRDDLASRPHAANALIKALRQVFRRAAADDLVEINPASGVPYIRPKSKGYHTWSLAEVAQFADRHPLGTKAYLALALLIFTGARRSDVVRLGRQMVKDGWIRFPVAKSDDEPHEIPFLPPLKAIVEASPTGDLTFIAKSNGVPYTKESFGNMMRDWCDEAGLSRCSAHGLRKAGATVLAEAGASEQQIMAIYKWESPKQAALYTKAARRRRLAEDGMSVFPLDLLGVGVPLLEINSESGTLLPDNLLKNND